MKSLGLDDFTAPIDDMEARQYNILALLQARQEQFSRSRLYPAFSELIEIRRSLDGLLRSRNELSANFPRTLTDVDWQKKELVFESATPDSPDLQRLFELSQWALPFIDNVLMEGRALYDFVDENVELEGVGILPVYTSEGYFFVPEHRSRITHILRYELSLLMNEGSRYQAMKTHELHQVQESAIAVAPQDLKMSLVAEHADLPNPATFVCETDLDFPYVETMLPVVKRKLMTQLVS